MKRLLLALLFGSLAAAAIDAGVTLAGGDPSRFMGLVWLAAMLYSWWLLGQRPARR